MAIKSTVVKNSSFTYEFLFNESIQYSGSSSDFGFILRDSAGNLNFQWKLSVEAACATKMKIALVSSNCLSSTWKINAQLYKDGGSSVVSNGTVTELFYAGRALQLPIKLPSDLSVRSRSLINYRLKSTFTVQEYSPKSEKPGDLCDDIETLFNNKKFCDIILKAQNKEIKAHKIILAARSPVFAAMFEHAWAENQSQTVVINDISFEVLQEMMSYIYTGKVKNIKEVHRDLLIAADKYDLQGLKAECEMEYCIHLSKQNCVETFVIADKLSSNNLKSKSFELIIKHIAEIMLTAEWKRLEQQDSKLIASIFRQYVLKNGR